jgi:hypothetical protein
LDTRFRSHWNQPFSQKNHPEQEQQASHLLNRPADSYHSQKKCTSPIVKPDVTPVTIHYSPGNPWPDESADFTMNRRLIH